MMAVSSTEEDESLFLIDRDGTPYVAAASILAADDPAAGIRHRIDLEAPAQLPVEPQSLPGSPPTHSPCGR
jgi:hypothetical protein